MDLTLKKIVVMGFGLSGAGLIVSLLLFAIWTRIASDKIGKAINSAMTPVNNSKLRQPKVSQTFLSSKLNVLKNAHTGMRSDPQREFPDINLVDVALDTIDGVVELAAFDKQIAIGAIWSLTISLVLCLTATILLSATLK